MSQTYLRMDPGEEVLFIARRHWINIFPIFFSTTVIVLVMVFALGWITANANLVPVFIPIALVQLAIVALGALAVLILVIAYLIFFQNRVILTNKHYIQITQSGLFDRTVSKLALDEIQDCKGNRRGFFATLLEYGEILIETAGQDENFDFKPVGDPLNLAEAINNAHQKYSPVHQPAPPPSPPPVAGPANS